MADFDSVKAGDRVRVTFEFTVDETYDRFPFGKRVTSTTGHDYYADDLENDAVIEVIS